MDRRSFLLGGVAALGAAATVPLSSLESWAASAQVCPCGCGIAPLKPRLLPTITNAHTSVVQFSSSGAIGVGTASSLGPFPKALPMPVTWRAGGITKLDPVNAAAPAQALAVNDLGAAVGGVDGNPLLWNESGGVTPLPRGAALRGSAQAISNDGRIVGNLRGNGRSMACQWVNGQLSFLPTQGAANSVAYHLSDVGVVAGAISGAIGDSWVPVIWQGQTLKLLSLGTQYQGATAFFSTTSGLVIGEAVRKRTKKVEAVVWQGSSVTAIGPVGQRSSAYSSTAAGMVVGDYTGSDGRRRSFVAQGRKWVQLDASSYMSRARSISANGAIGGTSAVSGLARPVAWSAPTF